MNNPSAPPLFNLKQLNDFFEHVGAKAGCPICDKADWLAASSGDKAFSACLPALPIKPNHIGIGIHYPCVLIICQNCGFIRPHHYSYIAEYLEKKKEID